MYFLYSIDVQINYNKIVFMFSRQFFYLMFVCHMFGFDFIGLDDVVNHLFIACGVSVNKGINTVSNVFHVEQRSCVQL